VLPHWVPEWCLEQLGREPVDVLFQLDQTSAVFGLRLADGSDVVVKARPDEGRAATCVAAQAHLAERGFPCARPLTPVVGVGSLAVHAEELRPGGDVLRGDSPAVAAHYAEVFARLAWQPEAALVGAASGAFASSGQPTLAPVESSAVFLETYEAVRGRRFTAAEREVAWAASLWTPAHNARWEALHGDPPVAGHALVEQAAERLRRANA
jgi:hypothetical protein